MYDCLRDPVRLTLGERAAKIDEFRAALLAFDPIDHHFHTTHSRIPSFSLD